MLFSLPWCLTVKPLLHHIKSSSFQLVDARWTCSSSPPRPSLTGRALSFLRVPGPQKPHSSATDDIVRANHYDPDEDEDYYRKQLSYFDKLQSGPNKPQAQVPHSYSR